LVRLASSHLTNILGIFRWDVGSIPLHVLAKVEKDENLASLICGSKVPWPVSLFAFCDIHVNHIIIFVINALESSLFLFLISRIYDINMEEFVGDAIKIAMANH
jgi:hypothetical protein